MSDLGTNDPKRIRYVLPPGLRPPPQVERWFQDVGIRVLAVPHLQAAELWANHSNTDTEVASAFRYSLTAWRAPASRSLVLVRCPRKTPNADISRTVAGCQG